MGLNDDGAPGHDPASTLGLLFWRRRLLEGFGRDTAGISPMTARGTVRVIAWLVATAAIALVGSQVAPALGGWWIIIALAVMIGVALWWERRAPKP